jgi:hypothetical protein
MEKLDTKQLWTSGPKLKADSYQTFDERYENVKQMSLADMDGVEKCFSKCQVSFRAQNEQMDKPCLNQCFMKFFDMNLLVDREISDYTHATPIL